MSVEHAETVFENLRLERLNVQKKTFTKWANVHLMKYGLRIDDLFQDLGDGLRLMKLLESLTGEKLGKPAKGSARINKIENVSRCLAFLHSKKMRLENISSEDIVDGKPHLILGLLWTIILRCEIWQNQQTANETETDYPVVPPPPPDQTYYPVQKIAKESLLLWCKTKTDGYPNVRVRDFHRSWRDGLAFNALIHSHYPALVNFQALKPHEHIKNLENAFDIAQKHIGVPRLLDPEDVDTDNPDEKSIIIYVSTFSKGLAIIKKGMTGGKRIANVLQKMIEIDQMKKDYDDQASELLEWINTKVYEFKYMQPLDSLESIQQEILQFKEYRTKEKPIKNDAKNEIEALLFGIQMKRLGKSGWVPPEETSPAAIEKAWSDLERAEHQHEIDVREQLKEQERLETLAYKFESKRAVREAFLKEMQKILTDPNYGSNIRQADATFKKHEAIRAGIISREIMIQDFIKIADTLIEGNYRKKDDIIKEKKEIEDQWKYVLQLLEAYDEKFAHLRQVMSLLEEMDSISDEMNHTLGEIETESEPLDIESSLQNHAVREVQIASWGEAIRRLEAKVLTQKDTTILQNQLGKLQQTHQNLEQTSEAKREYLEDLMKQKQQQLLVEELLSWVQEKLRYCNSEVNCKDLPSALLLQKKHKSLGSEIQLQKDISNDLEDQRLIKAFDNLENAYQDKLDRISLTIKFYEYSADAEECDSWISEKLHVLSSLDCGSDELTCEALMRRHQHMQTEILTYTGEIEKLKEDVEKIRLLQSSQPLSKICLMTTPEKSQLNKHNQPIEYLETPASMSQYLDERQAQIEDLFAELKRKCEERQRRLRHNTMFFRFKDGCEELEKWMRYKEKIVDTCEFDEEPEKVEKSFGAFLTDLVAHGLVFDDLKSIAEILEEEEAEQTKTVKILFDDLHRRWKHLHDLTRYKEENWKGFSSLMLAHRMCDETSSFLEEKCNMQGRELVEEIKNLDTLRRRQEAVERELEPVEERVKQALVLAENVTNSYPDQKETIQRKVRDLNEKWTKYQHAIKERKQKLAESAGLKIFQTDAHQLLEWAHIMITKLSVREKIGDIGVVESLIKDHQDLKDEINAQEERFDEVLSVGQMVLKQDESVRPLMTQLEEAKKSVTNQWEEKEIWLQQKRDLSLFIKEADHLQSLCTTQATLLDSAERGDTLSDVESKLRRHETLMETIKAQDSRFIAFEQSAKSLISSEHPESELIQVRTEQIFDHREKIKELAEARKLLLLEIYEFQEFKADALEMNSWIAEKTKLATDFSKQDIAINILYKMKRQQTFEAEIAANRERLQNTLLRGENLMKGTSNIKQNEVSSILKELGDAWNELIDKVEMNQRTLQQALALREFSNSADHIMKKMDEIIRAASSTNLGKDFRSVKGLIKELETLENERNMVKSKLDTLVNEGEQLVDVNCPEEVIRRLINDMINKAETLDKPLAERRQKLETCLKFHQFKSDVDRELVWISDQMVSLSSSPTCRNFLDAQKFMKKIENLEIAIETHKAVIEGLQEKVLLLVTEEECPVDVTQPCILMKNQWTQLLNEFNAEKEKAATTLKAQSFYCEAGEIDTWIAEKLEILTSTDYGKDEDAVIKLLTKHKASELEIDSYKGLVEELGSQADMLIEANHPDSKIIKNRMEVINQEMKNLQKLCTVKRQKLLESKSRYEFENETEELKEWVDEQMTEATSEDYGEDYEHILILHQNFEFFKSRVESGSKRFLQYEEFAKRLINSNCYFVEDVKKSLELLSAKWSDLCESIEARSFKMEAAAEIHRYHRDVTDILSRIHSHYRIIPQDLGNNLNQVQDLIKKHDKIENELLGVEAQVHILLTDSQRLQEAYPGGNEEHIQMQLALVIENWNLLQQRVSSRKTQLIAAQQVHKFLALVREEEIWAKTICLDLDSRTFTRDLQQLENEHKLLGDEIEARLSRYEELIEEGKSLQAADIFQSQIEEKLKSLSEICSKVRESYDRRTEFVQQKKNVILFFNEAKQIQATCAQREVQLCGSETKETVEDISNALKKHLEFQKTMEIQEEKFRNWKQQGEDLLRERVEESAKIEKKIEELSARRERLLNFSSERCKSLSEALQHAKFKRDTIEAESWLQEKKNKLRHVLKGYNQLSDEEKIKCLQKQQAVQAELDAHEPFINSIIQQSREFNVDEKAKFRLQLILEDWEEIKQNSAQISRDLLQARDMLSIHESFEKAESWIKEKELMIQANDTGKDYEHCMALQSKLDDVNSDTKLDNDSLKHMQELAIKLSRNEDHSGVFIRYERIVERWNKLQEEITLYRRKLVIAAQVHSFMKDIDDTIERIREKSLVLSAREDVSELNSVQVMQRKVEQTEVDLTALETKIKEQEQEARILCERHELEAGKIQNKMNQVHKEWNSLQEELKKKKQYIDSSYTCLKYMKDVNDFIRIINEIIAEMEFGELSSNSNDAQRLLRAHSDIQPQISMRQEEIKILQEKGEKLLRLPELFHSEIENCIQSLDELNNNLDASWHNRHKALLQCRDLQLFLEKTKQIENWLSAKEAFLANQDIGDSMSSVEALIRKHENFEETCQANFEKIREIEEMARDLKDHDDYELIQTYSEEICRRRDALQENCLRRKNILNDAKKLQRFLSEMYEISHWMDEKIRVASDESYRDLSNLLSKTQKHMAFEAEIIANHDRVVDFTKQAEVLIQDNHFASAEIKQHVENIENQWEKLMNATNNKNERLREASNALQFTRKLEDINSWMDEAEAQVNFEDYEPNVDSLQQELNKIQELQKEAEENAETLRLLNDLSDVFQQENHFSKEKIITEYKSTVNRFHSVENALHEKNIQLEGALWLAELDKDMSDELSWIEENLKLCVIEEQYDDVMTVQALQKKLQVMDTEILSREPLINSVVERGRRARGEAIEEKVNQLEESFQVLRDSVSLKRLRLADALESQKFYFEANQAEMWIKEKLLQVVGYEAERDVYSVQAIQKKLTAIDAATDSFRTSIQNLEEISSSLIARNHFDSQNIQTKQEEVNEEYEELRRCILKKTAMLREKEDYFLYEKEVRNLLSQLKSMTNIADSGDLGRDVEHVESLIQKFEVFGHKLRGYEATFLNLQDRGNELIQGGHTEFESANKLLQELETAWTNCKEAADKRERILEREKLIHTFYKSVDETESWITEKDVVLSSQDYGHDLESIKTLLRHHETLEGDLKAIEEQVQALKDEASVLKEQFPDCKEDIENKSETVQISWIKCKEKATNRKDKLLQAEQLQSYFDEARDFHAWIYEMSALLTSNELPQDVSATEALLAQHEGYKSEIDTQLRSFYLFEARGKEIIESGHFMSQDVETKVDALSASFKELLETWENRKSIYEQNLDLQLFKKKLIELETWLSTQEHNLNEENGRSVEEIEYLIQKHEQFQKRLELYEYKFQELVETTKLEKSESERREEEEKSRIEQEKLLEQQRLEEIRRKEEERLLEERRKERIPTEIREQDYDDDYLRFDSLPSEEPSRFTRMGSRRSYREQPSSERPSTPVIKKEKFRDSKQQYKPRPYIPPPISPLTTAEGFLARKEEFRSGGKRSTSRQWKNYYTVLCGQLLCFFKDKKSFLDSSALKPPVNILNANCYVPHDYQKKKYVFRLEIPDRSSFLFEAPNDIKRQEWIQKINYTAALPPNKQLMTAYDEPKLDNAEKQSSLKQPTVYEEPLYSEIKKQSSFDAGDNYRLRALSEESQGGQMSDEGHFKVSDDEGWYKESVGTPTNTTEIYDEPHFRTQSEVDLNKTALAQESKRHSSAFEVKSITDSFYADPFEEARLSFSATSYDDPESARSSLSNTSSYVTAAAASNTSLSTLQDDPVANFDDDHFYVNPHPTPRGSTTSDPHDVLSKHQSLTLPTIPTEDLFKKVQRKQKRRWFSLRNRH